MASSTKSEIRTTTIFISLKTHTSMHTIHICTGIQKTTEAGCQRGSNTYQCWPPLQLNDTIQVHKYTKSIKKKNTASIQANKSPCAEKNFLLTTAHSIDCMNISTCHTAPAATVQRTASSPPHTFDHFHVLENSVSAHGPRAAGAGVDWASGV